MKKFHFSYRYLIFFAVLALFIVFVWNPFNVGGGLRGAAIKIGHPFLKSFYFLGEKSRATVTFFQSISSLSKENERLLRENNQLTGKVGLLEETKRENEELRKQLELAPKEKFVLEAAFVINQSSFGSGSWVMIDKGRNQGITEGMPVIVYEGILVGRIKEVFANKSKVVLLSDPESVVNVKDAQTGTRGLVRGEYGTGIFLEMVEQGEAINQGDLLISSGLGGNIPENLLIGYLQSVQISEDRLFQQAIISPQVKYSNLKTVFVIKN